MRVLRQVKDRDLTTEQLASREDKRRHYEIDSQILNALEKGNPVELLLTHPAGLMGKGSCGHIHADDAQEVVLIRNRYSQLKARFDSGTEFQDIDDALAAEVATGRMVGVKRFDDLTTIRERGLQGKRGDIDIGPFPRARTLKDFSEYKYREWALEVGVLYGLSKPELVSEHNESLADLLIQVNEDRSALGLPAIDFVEVKR